MSWFAITIVKDRTRLYTFMTVGNTFPDGRYWKTWSSYDILIPVIVLVNCTSYFFQMKRLDFGLPWLEITNGFPSFCGSQSQFSSLAEQDRNSE